MRDDGNKTAHQAPLSDRRAGGEVDNGVEGFITGKDIL